MYYTKSKTIIKNCKDFFDIDYFHFYHDINKSEDCFVGWGRKKSGQKSLELAKKYSTKYKLLEDGFIRSLGLGIDDSPSFSIVVDDVGIYYDATTPSKLENILNNDSFNKKIIDEAQEAMALLIQYNISKYNSGDETFKLSEYDRKNRVLIIAQTAGDMSLKYGLGEQFTTQEMIEKAYHDNSDAEVYLKVHPDVVSGKKVSDINIEALDKRVTIVDKNINPIVLLKQFSTVYTKTSQMGFEALLVGCECVCFGMPFYAGWGVTTDMLTCERRIQNRTVEEIFAAAYILYTKYFNPYTQQPSTLLQTLNDIKLLKESSRISQHLFFGFSYWKHEFIKVYFPYLEQNNINFINSSLQKYTLHEDSEIYIWGRKNYHDIELYAKQHYLKLYRVEDGFIRSVGLGSDLTQPYSLVVDSRGIYFDPTQESDLEHIIINSNFDKALLRRAEKLRIYLVEKKLSKYNLFKNIELEVPQNKKIVLVPAQVEDDASIKYGAPDMTNIKLLQMARKNAPDAYIIYKPHPDVLAGNRKGAVDDVTILKYADIIVTEVGLDTVLDVSDEVHTMTSLVGFEALTRGKKVFTYGMPFYAGWGLTHDSVKCSRRVITRSLDELVAATLILYPKYIHPQTLAFCEVEELLLSLDKEREKFEKSLLYRMKINIRNAISRKSQLILRIILAKR
jgi:capsular polysaccharide export protein